MSDTRVTGSVERGRRLAGGDFRFAGISLSAPGQDIWELSMPSEEFEAAIHGFEWLDDLTAVCDLRTNRLAQDWTHDWIRRCRLGSGAGWTPELTGRRVLRWINHADQLLAGQRFGLIRFGSRLDVYLPNDHESMVCVGQRAIAGETVLADLKSGEAQRNGRTS